ncbi:MAG: hypothetical protein JXB03_07990 [Spirochaetales bacterium]|nr:hypothetical protein [Spirochaetales bacterium]
MAKKKTSTHAQDLIKLLPQIDDEGLLFLLRQANTLIYNQKVDELNLQAEQLSQSREKGKAGPGKAVAKKGPQAARTAGEYPVSIEKGAFGTSYIMAIGTTRKTFAEYEMLALVQVCNAAEGKADAMVRMYRWLDRNRDDVLLDAGIGSAKHPALGAMYAAFKETFRVRKA